MTEGKSRKVSFQHGPMENMSPCKELRGELLMLEFDPTESVKGKVRGENFSYCLRHINNGNKGNRNNLKTKLGQNEFMSQTYKIFFDEAATKKGGNVDFVFLKYKPTQFRTQFTSHRK